MQSVKGRMLLQYQILTYFLLGVSAKHLREDVSTTVSQKATTGSATLMSARKVKGQVLNFKILVNDTGVVQRIAMLSMAC